MNQKQTNIYDYLSKNDDEFYIKLSELNKGDSISIENIIIFLNKFGFFEVSYQDEEESAFQQLTDCYNYVSEKLDELKLK
ncbi:hypothetical protein [Oceanobacillus timonensis]|uniref:hypothetical protein n=1 Tax=Oceanobacillus timonensis TaxID=1926285 RepID=UPI0009BAC3F4|nr:hypothetical protein [Oceanobacillus timonensis]